MEVKNERIGTYCDKCCNVICRCKPTTMENTIEQEAESRYPNLRKLSHWDNFLIEAKRKAFIDGSQFANSQISHHLDKLTEEIKENVIEIQHSIDAKTGRKAITKITAEYKLKNKL